MVELNQCSERTQWGKNEHFIFFVCFVFFVFFLFVPTVGVCDPAPSPISSAIVLLFFVFVFFAFFVVLME